MFKTKIISLSKNCIIKLVNVPMSDHCSDTEYNLLYFKYDIEVIYSIKLGVRYDNIILVTTHLKLFVYKYYVKKS